MPLLRHFTAVLCATLALLSAGPARAQEPAAAQPTAGEATYVVFIGGREVGREQVSVARTSSGWRITSTGQLVAPVSLTTHSFELTYAPDWQPLELKISAKLQEREIGLATTFGLTTAVSEITQNGVTNTKTDQITARTVVLPNNFYAGYEALAVRLASSKVGDELPVYVAPQAEILLSVKAVADETFQTAGGTVTARRFTVMFQNPGGPLDAEIMVDDRNRFARADLAGGNLSIARQDLADVSTRQQTLRNPTDVDVRIPAAGFTLAGVITTPAAQGRQRHPTIVLVAGSGPIDRDSTVAGIPLFAQLAGQLAEQGYVVLRYDKRGVGQSGGRIETVTLQDYADDANAAVRFVSRRRDVDNRRIAVAGHSEGASVAMLLGREKRVAALVLMSAMGTTGRELVLEQQQYLLNVAKVPEPERSGKVDLQEKILEAAVDEDGWEALPAEVRPLVDTPWYRSLLTFNPAEIMPRVRQPVLILQGGLDTQVPPHHAEKLAEIARARRNAPPVEVKLFPSLNHLLAPAETGHVAEYATLKEKAISPEVAKAIAEWLPSAVR